MQDEVDWLEAVLLIAWTLASLLPISLYKASNRSRYYGACPSRESLHVVVSVPFSVAVSALHA